MPQTQQRPRSLDRDAELLPQLASKSIGTGLARLDLAARKLPTAGEVLAGGSLRDENPAAPVEEHGRHDMNRGLAVHGARG